MSVQQPSVIEIMSGTAHRQAYVAGLEALGVEDNNAVIIALAGLHSANRAGQLEPPLPSVRARQVEDTVNFATENDFSLVDPKAARLLLAIVVDHGITRYPNG